MKFSERLFLAVQKKKSRLCVGLDPRLDLLPRSLINPVNTSEKNEFSRAGAVIAQFDRRIIDAIEQHAVAVKFQSAFYEQYGPAGLRVMWEGIQYAKSKELIVIVDAKRGDIDSTALAYANTFLGRTSLFGKDVPVYDVDCLTVNPFLGKDSLVPFITTAKSFEKGLFILVKTSNPGSADFQGIIGRGVSMSESIAQFVNEQSQQSLDVNGYSSIGAVVGATYAEDAQILRKMMPHSIFLVPGIGAQGGSLTDLPYFFDSSGFGALVSASRGVVYSYIEKSESDFEKCVEESARMLKNQINIALHV